MRMWPILTVALAAFSTSAIGATDQQCIELWNGTCVGMSVEQVMQDFPQAKVLPPGLGETDADGAVALVRAPTATLWGVSFLPKFYFKDGSLSYVVLWTDNASLDANVAQSAFDTLTADFQSKYGKGAIAESEHKFPTAMRAINFLHDRTSITAVDISNSKTSVLIVRYGQSLASNAIRRETVP